MRVTQQNDSLVPTIRTVIMTAKDGALVSILSIWPSNFPLEQEKGRKRDAEPNQ